MCIHPDRLILIFIILNFVSGCRPVEPVIVPDDLPYVGKWSGNTAQMTYIELEIREINSQQMLYSFTFNYWLDSLLKQRTLTGEKGLFRIEENQFTVDLPDRGYITGTFQSQNHLSGKLRVLAENDAYDEFTWDATHLDSTITINSIARARFTARDITYTYEQVINDFFPYPANTLNDTALSTGAKFRIEKGMYNGQSVFLFIAKGFSNLQEISQFYTSGSKRYSPPEAVGIEYTFFDPETYWEKWSSAWGCADQPGSYFRIIETRNIPFYDADTMQRMKILTEFGCYVYGVRGDTLQIKDGFFLGFVDLPKAGGNNNYK